MFKLNGNPIRLDQDLVIGEGDEAITIPAASLLDQATREQYGIVEVADEPRPDDRFYWVGECRTDGTYPKAPKDLDTVRALKLADIAASRYAIEVGGLTLPDGAKIKTDRESQSLVASALLRVQRNPALLIDWKGENGWVKIDKAAVEAIADAVGDHVQACFTAERIKADELKDVIAAGDFEDIVAFDTAVTL